jgi:hypothetical protein
MQISLSWHDETSSGGTAEAIVMLLSSDVRVRDSAWNIRIPIIVRTNPE